MGQPQDRHSRRAANAAAGVPLRAYLIGLLALFVVVAAATTLYGRAQAIDDAGDRATEDAVFGAGLAAQSIAGALEQASAVIAQTATTPNIAQAFNAPAGCSLLFSGAGPFTDGHIDVVAPDGHVGCSSLTESLDRGYADADWFAQATTTGGLTGPVVDARTGEQAMVVSAPIPGGGAVVGFLDLDAVAPALHDNVGGPRGLEVVVTTQTHVLSRSTDPDRWAFTPLAGTGFERTGDPERVDLDGTMRFYGDVPVAGTDWVVHAGADRAEALAGANERAVRTFVATAAGLLVLLVAALWLHRRITRPIRRISTIVRDATAHPSPVSVDVGGPQEIRSLAGDFSTLLATAERELATTARLATIVESSPDAIISATPDGIITTWNPAAERIYGYRTGDAIGQRTQVLVPDDLVDDHRRMLRRVADGEPIPAMETRCVRADGTIIDISLAVAPLRAPDGSITGMSAISRDITAQKALDAERRLLEQRVSQTERLESLGQLAGGIAHDFNNLLSIIINYAQLAIEELPEDSPVRRDIEEVRAAGESAARLTRQLLVFGKRDQVDHEPIDVDAVVSDIHNLLARSIGEHVALEVYLAGSLPHVLVDRGQLEQIVLNLAINARDAMPDGGRLTIETRTVHIDEEYCRLHPGSTQGTNVELAVSDNGTGMSPDVAARVFEPFFTTKDPGKGTGLGLATIYGIVTAVGGTITLYSEPGIGTTFRVRLPAVDDPARTGRGDAGHPIPRGAGETIVVAEDEPAVMELTTRLLLRNGYQVIAATTSDEAHAAATTGAGVRLLLTDSVMPEMSGQALAARVHAVRPNLPVLFMSGYSHGVLGPQPGDHGGAGFIQKPFTEAALLEGVRDALAGTTPPERVRRAPD